MSELAGISEDESKKLKEVKADVGLRVIRISDDTYVRHYTVGMGYTVPVSEKLSYAIYLTMDLDPTYVIIHGRHYNVFQAIGTVTCGKYRKMNETEIKLISSYGCSTEYPRVPIMLSGRLDGYASEDKPIKAFGESLRVITSKAAQTIDNMKYPSVYSMEYIRFRT